MIQKTKINKFSDLFITLAILFLLSCNKENIIPESSIIKFGIPKKVTVNGYNDDIMEPFLSRDGNILFFNNLNDPSVNTNIHYAKKTDDFTFEYQGELKGLNTESLEGVASSDLFNAFYFISTRSYDETLSTIYCGYYTGDSINNILLLDKISKNTAGWVIFDVEVSQDGNSLYMTDGRFDALGGPYEADLSLASKKNDIFERESSTSIFQNINTASLEYAACTSSDMLELYFTRFSLPSSDSVYPQIYVATRNSIKENFQKPYKINEITGFVEAPALSPDNKAIYFHKKENDKYVLYRVEKITLE